MILESMKMEMPVEAEDEGTVNGDPRRGGPGGLRGRHARRARVRAASRRRVDSSPPRGVPRLTISNPAKRNALDHAILDALAATLPALDARCVRADRRGRRCSRAGYDIGDLPPERFAEEAVGFAHPFEAALEALEPSPFPSSRR